MLGMDVHKPGCDTLEDLERDGRIINERSGTAGRRNHPADEQFSGVIIQIIFMKKVPHDRITFGNPEKRLDDTIVSMGADHRCVSLGAKQQRQSPEQDGFSRSGLSCNNDETLRKNDIQRVYQNVIPNLKGLEHGQG